MECPWGCGWKGDPSEYLKHLETCPKHPDAQKPPSQDARAEEECFEGGGGDGQDRIRILHDHGGKTR